MKIGVLGGSFNPPHLGHLLMCFYALGNFWIDRILVVPCYKHPFGKRLAKFEHRMKMCKLLFGKFKGLVEISDIEKRLGTVNKTLITLEELAKHHKKDKFTLIVGSDILREKHKWYKIKVLERRFGMLIVPRGKTKRGIYIPDIKSSVVRKRIKAGESVSGYTMNSVKKYIKSKKLYL